MLHISINIVIIGSFRFSFDNNRWQSNKTTIKNVCVCFFISFNGCWMVFA